jgi:tripartite-type tricarboxylate transporter receptor subunit TctC
MKHPWRAFQCLAAAAAMLFVLSTSWAARPAWSQGARTIRLIVPFAAGGSFDVQARLLAEQISRTHGTTMVVENRPGGGTVIGTEAAARAAPDGNTLLLVGYSFLINANLKKLNYEPLTSFDPVCYLTRSSMGVVVNSPSPYRKLSDLIEAARGKPGTLTLATAGAATAPHFAFEALKLAARIDITHIPYSGAAPAVNALLGDHVAAMLSDYPAVMEHIRSGKLRPLVTASRVREDTLPDVPTVEESGYKDYDADNMLGVVAPARTSSEVLNQTASWFDAALKVPEIKTKLATLGLSPVGVCGGDFGAHLRKKNEEYGRIIREANIKAE